MTWLGLFAGETLAGGILTAADHVGHHHDALGTLSGILLFIALTVLGALIGRAAE